MTLAEKKENISFSAGASYDEVFTQDSTWENSYEFTRFLDVSLGLSAVVEVDAQGVWLEAENVDSELHSAIPIQKILETEEAMA